MEEELDITTEANGATQDMESVQRVDPPPLTEQPEEKVDDNYMAWKCRYDRFVPLKDQEAKHFTINHS